MPTPLYSHFVYQHFLSVSPFFRQNMTQHYTMYNALTMPCLTPSSLSLLPRPSRPIQTIVMIHVILCLHVFFWHETSALIQYLFPLIIFITVDCKTWALFSNFHVQNDFLYWLLVHILINLNENFLINVARSSGNVDYVCLYFLSYSWEFLSKRQALKAGILEKVLFWGLFSLFISMVMRNYLHFKAGSVSPILLASTWGINVANSLSIEGVRKTSIAIKLLFAIVICRLNHINQQEEV